MSNNPRYPIILAHGIARFDVLREVFLGLLPQPPLGDGLHYFKGIKSDLESNGFEVHHSSVSFAAGVKQRSVELRADINAILAGTAKAGHSHEKIHIIAHSMGGLDARRMIVDSEEMAGKVASLTTIGTPHLGATLADLVIRNGGHLLIHGLRPFIHLEGFADLTTDVCGAFNRKALDREAKNGVVYRTYASAEERDLVFLPLQASWLIINHHEGENDGLVSVKSQQWEKELVAQDGKTKPVTQSPFPIPADHLNEVGWWDPQESNPVAVLRSGRLQAQEYERKIKDAYLIIAKEAVG